MALPYIARYVSEKIVISMLYFLAPNSPYIEKYGEISAAIAKAANEDPLFPHHGGGAEMTASILVALAYKESSFHQSVIGDKGKSFGLFQIQLPTAGPRIKANILLQPMSASKVAVDLIRRSFQQCEHRNWYERLSWYVASNGCPNHVIIVKKSAERLILAGELYKKFFPDQTVPDRVPRLGEAVEERHEP